MTWPYTPLTTYVAGTTPAIKASDLNSMQAQINRLSLGYALRRQWWELNESWATLGDAGRAIGASWNGWALTGTGTGTALVNYVQGFPACELLTSTGGTDKLTLKSSTLFNSASAGLAVASFEMALGGTANSYKTTIGWSASDEGVGNHFARVKWEKGVASDHWTVKTSNGGSASSEVDSGIAPSTNLAAPDRFRIEYAGNALIAGGRVKYYINDSLIATHVTAVVPVASSLTWDFIVTNASGTANAAVLSGPTIMGNRSSSDALIY